MEATSESSDPKAVNLPVIDLRLVSQSELYTISLSHATGCNRRIDEDCVIPKIDRSVFKESTGSRKQTFSRLRLFPRNNNNPYSPVPAAVAPVAVVPAPSSSSSRIAADGENSQIIDLLQELFGVEPLRGAYNDHAVPLQVEFKQPALEFTPQAVQNVPIDGSQTKRKRGRPRKSETPGSEALLAICDGNGKAMETDDEKKVETVNGKKKKVETENEKKVEAAKEKQGFVLEDAGDPFVEELIVRTQGMNTEPELLEFLEGLNGVWGSDRKKRRIVDASCLRDVLPTGWKLILTLQRRGSRASVLCRRYVSPDGGQFETYKDVSSYLVSLFNVQDAGELKSCYTDGSKQFSSNINISENQIIGHVPTGGIKIDASESSHHEKQATISSPIGAEKRNTSDGKLNGDLEAMDCELGDATNGAFRVSDHPTDDKLPLKADKKDANSVQESFLSEDRVYNQSVGPIPTCGMKIDANTSSHQRQATLSSSIGAGCYKTVPYGNEQVRVGDNGLGLSATLMENHIQKIASESSMLVPNSQDISTNGKLQFCPEGSFVPSQNELNHTSIESMDREQTFELKDSAGAKKNYNDLPGSSTDEKTWDHNDEYMDNISFDPWQQDAPVSDVIDYTPNLYVTNGVSDDHALPLDEVATSSLQKMSSLNDQICTMDKLLHRRSESNLFTVAGSQPPSALHDNMNNISAGAFGAVKHVDASPRVLQGGSQSVSPGGNMLNQFDKKNDDGVNNGNTSCLSDRYLKATLFC
ncbi:methyl-CpG-binding domain-containing protein 8 isoform X4 [Lathyrus oleraceus]|uniref:methyl-CpG-binding domain-containing protein 8 isoform X4 n=1 Tax=Pisum sativum TaxID=3888 RepID=UPI0021CFD7CE|nr:methyl-CpG-binding domain-containing protein 8-like isoform X4 [Pisum sativum]